MSQNDFKIFVPLLKASRDSDGKRRFHGIASSTVKDRHGDTITLSALKEMESTASNNMTIFLNHEYRVPEDVAGSVERAVVRNHPVDPNVHDLVFDIVVNESNPRAIAAWEAIENGTQLGLSIGARIPDGGAIREKGTGRYTIEHIDLLETSLVGVPANPRSWVEYAVKSLNGSAIRKDDDAEDADVETVEEASAPAEEPVLVEASSDDPDVVADVDVSDSSEGDTDAATTDQSTVANSADAEVTIDTDGGNAATAPQDAPESNPENGEIAPTMEELDIEPTLMASFNVTQELLKSITRELVDTKAALTIVEQERDQAKDVAEKALSSMADLLDRIAQTPLGKRTTVVEASQDFESLKAVYSEAFVNLLQKKDNIR